MAKKNSHYWYRTLHRDIAYFYVGLIIAFSFSGIVLNHRRTIDPQEYTVKAEKIQVSLTQDRSQWNDGYMSELAKTFTEESYKSFRDRGEEVRLYFEDAFASVDVKSGAGEIEYVKTIPVLGQMTILHKSTNTWWIWFSDIFGVAMLIIAITGMFIAKGKYNFKKRGLPLAIIGLIFPFIFLFLIH